MNIEKTRSPNQAVPASGPASPRPLQAPPSAASDTPASAGPQSTVSVKNGLKQATAEPTAVSFQAGRATSPSLAGYAPKAGSYSATEDATLMDIRSLGVRNVTSGSDRLSFTLQLDLDMQWPVPDKNKTLPINVQRTPGTNRVSVDMGEQGKFDGTISFGQDGTLSISPNEDQGAGGIDRISIGRGGQPVVIKIQGLTGGQITINARPA